MRIAARSIRSALTTYAPLLDSEATDAVRDELRWLGQVLSEARDAQVLRERLVALLADEPDELVLGPVASLIDDDLRRNECAGNEQARAALDSPRYYRLLDALDGLIESPPLTADADEPAREVLPRLLQRDAKRLRRAVRAASGIEPGTPRDLALHEVRKKAKRLRYAAESTVPVLGKRAKKLASAAKRVQCALGEHQDSVMARRVLREQGARAHVAGRNGFTFGRMHALEEARADPAVRDFEAAWGELRTRKLRHRLTN
jgi:CHAD domain-containing protein